MNACFIFREILTLLTQLIMKKQKQQTKNKKELKQNTKIPK